MAGPRYDYSNGLPPRARFDCTFSDEYDEPPQIKTRKRNIKTLKFHRRFIGGKKRIFVRWA